MVIFFSGSCGLLAGGVPAGEPETVFRERECNLMLSYYLITHGDQQQDQRLPVVVARQRSLRRGHHPY